ncbi:MAG TPA: Gfo/Idh/MocA family oxidoreductase [Opitutaceae bacterium]|nr:Gfo/Idh/MocA family oxidoreductase [Opitutaceae bacterium]
MNKDDTGSGYGLSEVDGSRVIAAPVLSYFPSRPRAYRPKIALIGCGGIAEYHLRAYRALGLDVVALCDRDPARAEKRRAEFYPHAAISADYREVLRRDEVEIVDVATHPHERLGIIEAALLAGKHVLSQKPFVLDLVDGRRLVALAREKGRKLAVNQNGRWAPHLSWLAAAVHGGLIGDVATIDFTLQWDHTWTTGTAFEDVRHLVLFDFGIHWFDATARLMRGKTPQRVWASAARASFQKMRPPILAQAVIDYADAQVRLSFNGHVKYGQEDRTVICGSRGTLRSFGPSLSEQAVVLHTAAGEARPKLEGTWFAHGFQGAMAELICAIEDDRAPVHDAAENLASLALCFAAVASADEGRPIVPGTVDRLPS